MVLDEDDLAVRAKALEMAVKWANGDGGRPLAQIVSVAALFERYLRGEPDPNLKIVNGA